MAKYRVWAQSISDVYIDIEAETEEQAREFADEYTDGGEWHEDYGSGDWIIGSSYQIDDNDDVDYTLDEVKEMTED